MEGDLRKVAGEARKPTKREGVQQSLVEVGDQVPKQRPLLLSFRAVWDLGRAALAFLGVVFLITAGWRCDFFKAH